MGWSDRLGNFRIVVKRVIEQYFKQPNYLKLDGKPVFSIFSLDNLIKTFGDLEGTCKGLDYFRSEVKKQDSRIYIFN